MYKTVCAAFIWMPWDARSCRYVFILREKFFLYLKCNLKKVLEQERKPLKKMNKKVGMLLQKNTDTRGVGISSMRKSI